MDQSFRSLGEASDIKAIGPVWARQSVFKTASLIGLANYGGFD